MFCVIVQDPSFLLHNTCSTEENMEWMPNLDTAEFLYKV